MAGVNKVILVGNLGRDPELRYTQAGNPVAQLNIATTRRYTNKQNETVEETEWHRVSVWGKQAEHCQKFLSKGRQVYVEGRLQTSSYEQDGIKKYSTEVVAQTVQFLGGKGDGAGASSGGGSPSGDNQVPLSSGGGDDVPF
jgi:single-strand DNA-binding protein